ncbi:DUF6371 domain-containing protein [Flavobacterium sp. ZE23DGlu08]|uniref:DUF6371 domain-containing protein n=1 Tax=Flavobacterium sp. ZE23DGlu08 TaxID=3059026 RepID=UPI00265F0381|nr:DUF6371 domain-containing protein [Flavobacterium sp. ZE23DGlu08]WKL44897.1 DUF6371 domain-containing protein [Flavobacterium sp. ZE23DGlu08]
MYKYSLDKSSKKFICPNCSKKKFVKYVDNESNAYLEDGSGRCDNDSSCKHHQYPNKNCVISEFIKPIITRQASTLQSDLLVLCGRNFNENNLVQFLKIYFSEEEVQSVILQYRLGTSKHWLGSTIFWQINPHNKIMTGKVMLFNIKTGKRIKTPFNHIHWVHSLLKLNDYVLQQCLFGLHLINESTKNKIAIVESEKTALIMSLFLPDYIWMATGSKSNFKKELLEPIKNFKIIVYPDKSEYNDWNKKATQLNKEGYQIRCSDYVEKKDVPEGTDLADIYFESKTSEIVEIKYTKTEIEVNRLAKINPAIINLIRTFDLLDVDHNGIRNID